MGRKTLPGNLKKKTVAFKMHPAMKEIMDKMEGTNISILEKALINTYPGFKLFKRE